MVITTKFDIHETVLVNRDIEAIITSFHLYGSTQWYTVAYWNCGERKQIDVLEIEIDKVK